MAYETQCTTFQVEDVDGRVRLVLVTVISEVVQHYGRDVRDVYDMFLNVDGQDVSEDDFDRLFGSNAEYLINEAMRR
jgi:hypothetical protein